MSRFRQLSCACVLLAFGALPLRALIDRDGDGISDVWTALHPGAGEPAADDDGDGVSNRAEALAGTDPLAASSCLAAVVQSGDGGELRLGWCGVAGRKYRIESSTDLKTWALRPETYLGTGAELWPTVRPAAGGGGPADFWRVIVQDVDTDGDGFNDWEELQLGMDPLVPNVAPALPDAQLVPEYLRTRLAAITAPTLAYAPWTKVKIPGLREQVLDAQVNGRNRVWDNIAPGFTNVIYDAKVDAGVITIILDLGGLAQSTDGGQTWRAISYQLPGYGNYQCFFSFDVSPVSAGVILASGSYLSRTTDGGKTWAEVQEEVLPPINVAPTYGADVRGYRTAFGKVRFNSDGSRVFAALGALGHDLSQRGGEEDEMAAMFGTKRVYVGDGEGRNFAACDLSAGGTVPVPFAGIRCIYPLPTDRNTAYFSFGDGTLFVTRNATASNPTFRKLGVPAGYQIIDIDASPWTSGDLLLTLLALAAATPSHKVVLAHDSGGTSLTYTDIAVKDTAGYDYLGAWFTSAKWNPRLRGQVFLGAENINYLLVSDDGMSVFRKVPFPAAAVHGDSGFYTNPHWFAFDRKTDLAVTWSCLGAWSSNDGFANWGDLLMTYDEGTKLFGNKGVGYAECALDLSIGPSNAYMATNDHGVFRSNGADRTKWRRISQNPGMPQNADGTPWASLAFPMGVAPDESCIYTVARGAYPNNPYTNNQLKLMRSRDQGETWTDVTSLLSTGTTLSSGLTPKEFRFSPDGRFQWLMFDKALYFSVDTGRTFAAADPLGNGGTGVWFGHLAYDATHDILYATTDRGLIRSFDGGSHWSAMNVAYTAAIGVTRSGDLVIGFYGKLVVVPFSQIEALVAAQQLNDWTIPQSLVKATVGDTVEEVAASIGAFSWIFCEGDTVLAGCVAGSYLGNRTCSIGPLLSRDGGSTFHWAAYNLPVSTIFSAAVGPDDILLGCAGGAYCWDLKRMPANPAPAP